MKVDDFDFALPQEFIAQRPVSPRDTARLLLVENMSDHIMRELPKLCRKGDMLVFNDTRVIPARLKGRRRTAGIEVTLHKRTSNSSWDVFARPARKLKAGDRIDFTDDFHATVTEKKDGGDVSLQFDRSGLDLLAALEAHGGMPLPPYIKREGLADEQDKKDYQTLFADRDGAVAAPTAGLHFTPELMAGLQAGCIGNVTLTLHVGAGTFLPVKADDTEDHTMHAEWGEISPEVADRINRTKADGGRIIAVGTTSLRLLESATDEKGRLNPFAGETDIFITPGYKFRIVDRLLTNFHLPRSTLFMLVSAFAGLERMKNAYAQAMERGYRFYSYGDGCLLDRDEGL